MAAQEGANARLDFRDLGVPRSLLAASTIALAVAAGAAATLLGGPPLAGAGAAIAASSIAFVCGRMLTGRLRDSLRDPVDALLRTLDQIRLGGAPTPVPEDGAPLLQPLLRRFQMTHATVEHRSQQTVANLMQAEAAFDRVHAVLQSLREGVVVVDTNGRVVLMNRNARRMLGLGDRRAEAEPLLQLCSGPLGAAMQDGLSRLADGRVADARIADVPHGKQFFDVSVVQVQSNRPGQDYGKVLVLADVTQRHEVDRLKDDLLSSISHELRTPLTNMVTGTEILTTMTPTSESEWRGFAEMLATESKRLEKLVEDVVLFGQLSNGRAEWRPETIDLRDIAGQAIRTLEGAASEKGQHIEVEGSIDATTQADPRRLRSALCRVLDNAVKFAPHGGRIRVSFARANGHAEIRVDDNGPGVEEKDRQRVFERFEQVGDVLTDKPKGAGLGLAIVRCIVALAGGSVRCEGSNLGGARFVVSLPVDSKVAARN